MNITLFSVLAVYVGDKYIPYAGALWVRKLMIAYYRPTYDYPEVFRIPPRLKKIDNMLTIIIKNSICLRHISSNKTIQRRIALYRNLQSTLKKIEQCSK